MLRGSHAGPEVSHPPTIGLYTESGKSVRKERILKGTVWWGMLVSPFLHVGGVPYPQAQRMLLLENGDLLYLQKRVPGIFPPGQFFTWGVGLGGKGVL